MKGKTEATPTASRNAKKIAEKHNNTSRFCSNGLNKSINFAMFSKNLILGLDILALSCLANIYPVLRHFLPLNLVL